MTRHAAGRALGNAGLLLAGTVFCLLLAEALCAWLRPASFVELDLLGRRPWARSGGAFLERAHGEDRYPDLVPGSSGFQRLRGNYDCHWTIDSLGLRSPEALATPKQAFRILALGDSQTFGLGVAQHETFCARLAFRLTQPGGRQVAVLNAGVPSYGTYEELWKLERVAPLVRPDLVLVVVHLDNALVPDAGNDLYNNFERLSLGRGAPLHEVEDAFGGASFLMRHSHLYTRALLLLRRLRGEASHLEKVRASRKTMARELEGVWKETRRLLARIDEVARSVGARTLVVHLPAPPSLELDDRSALAELRASGIPVASVFAALQAERRGDTRRVCFPNDGHYNASAHARIAAALAQELEERGLVPAGPRPGGARRGVICCAAEHEEECGSGAACERHGSSRERRHSGFPASHA